jgi:hypothetical protein
VIGSGTEVTVAALARAGEAVAKALTPDPDLRQARRISAHTHQLVAGLCLLGDVKGERARANLMGRIAGAAHALRRLNVDPVPLLQSVAAVLVLQNGDGPRDADTIWTWCAEQPA